jgi:hypothetical protein
MDVPISNSLRATFLVHMIVALVLGAALLLVPGRTLSLLGWVPEQVQFPVQSKGIVLAAPGTSLVDPVITRLLGAALLALGFSSFLGWRAGRREQVKLLVQTEFVFCVVGIVAILSGLFTLLRPMPAIGWVIAAILLVFAVLWGLALRR